VPRESEKPAVGFPLSLGPPGCGNVGIAERFPRAMERVENLFLVSRLFTARHFHSLYAFAVWSNRDYRSNASRPRAGP
jgi:hypothetical protein